MGLDKCRMTCIHHYNIIQSIFTALKILCVPPIHPSTPPQPLHFFNWKYLVYCHVFRLAQEKGIPVFTPLRNGTLFAHSHLPLWPSPSFHIVLWAYEFVDWRILINLRNHLAHFQGEKLWFIVDWTYHTKRQVIFISFHKWMRTRRVLRVMSCSDFSFLFIFVYRGQHRAWHWVSAQ